VLIKLSKYHYDKIIVGGGLHALLYAHENNIPIIINRLERPHQFEKHNSKSSLELWNQLFFILSLNGLNLVGDKANSVRIKEEEIAVSTKDARVIKFTYDKIIVFDDENVSGLPMPKKENEDFIVLDWMIARSCETHPYQHFKTEDLFVNEIYFY